MLTINSFEIASDATKLDLTVTTDSGQTISSIEVRDVFSYETQEGVDVSSKISGLSNTETIEITAADLSKSLVEGLYYVVVTDTLSQTKTGVVLNLVPHIDYFISLSVQFALSCDCKDASDLGWTKFYGFIDALKFALLNNLYYDANQIYKTLSKSLCLDKTIDYADFPLSTGSGLKTVNDIVVEV